MTESAYITVKDIQNECDGVYSKWADKLSSIEDKTVLVGLFGFKECIVAHLSDIIKARTPKKRRH